MLCSLSWNCQPWSQAQLSKLIVLFSAFGGSIKGEQSLHKNNWDRRRYHDAPLQRLEQAAVWIQRLVERSNGEVENGHKTGRERQEHRQRRIYISQQNISQSLMFAIILIQAYLQNLHVANCSPLNWTILILALLETPRRHKEKT